MKDRREKLSKSKPVKLFQEIFSLHLAIMDRWIQTVPPQIDISYTAAKRAKIDRMLTFIVGKTWSDLLFNNRLVDLSPNFRFGVIMDFA